MVDVKLYWGACETRTEADYLVAVLNAEPANEAIKPFQSLGLMGVRDIHKKVLDLPIPRYNPGQEKRRALGNLGAEARRRASTLITSNVFPRSIAAQRAWIRVQLRDLLEQIDKVVTRLL